MPSTGNSHLVVFERLPDGDERVLDPGFWLKQQERRDWNRIKLDTFVPVLVGEQPTTPKKSAKKAAAEPVESASKDDKVPSEKKAKPVKVTAAKEARQKPKPTMAKKEPKQAAVADGGVQQPDAASAQPDTTAEAPATECVASITPQE